MTQKIKSAWHNFLQRRREYNQKKVDYYLLMNMTDRDLQDIGISRSEIKQRIFNEPND